MGKEEIIKCIERFYSNKFTKEDVFKLLLFYCISHEKSVHETELFIKMLTLIGRELICYDYVIDYYTRKYKLILVTDKKGKFIKVLKNEKINSKTICNSEEGSSECESSSS